jgi:hypothetical protein
MQRVSSEPDMTISGMPDLTNRIRACGLVYDQEVEGLLEECRGITVPELRDDFNSLFKEGPNAFSRTCEDVRGLGDSLRLVNTPNLAYALYASNVPEARFDRIIAFTARIKNHLIEKLCEFKKPAVSVEPSMHPATYLPSDLYRLVSPRSMTPLSAFGFTGRTTPSAFGFT